MSPKSKKSPKDFVLGYHAVQSALESSQEIYQAYLQEGQHSKRHQAVEKGLQDRQIPISYRSKRDLDQLTQGANHQGFVLEVAAYQYYSVDDLFQVAKDRGEDPFFILLDGIMDPHNLGSILRTADACGAHGIIIPKHRAAGVTPTVAKISTGAIEYVPVARVTNMTQTIEELKERGLWVFGTDMEGQDYWNMDASLPIAVVIGNEERGISPRVKKALDGVLTIPMRGHVQSLNASVAAALVMYEVYGKRRLTP